MATLFLKTSRRLLLKTWVSVICFHSDTHPSDLFWTRHRPRLMETKNLHCYKTSRSVTENIALRRPLSTVWNLCRRPSTRAYSRSNIDWFPYQKVSLCLCVYISLNGIIYNIVVTQHCTRWKNRSATSMSPVLNRRANRLPPTTLIRPWRTRVIVCWRPSLGLPMPLLQPKTLLLKYVGECLWSQIAFVFTWLWCVTVTIVSERTFE